MSVPATMRAVIIPDHGDAEVLQYTEVPTPRPGPGHVAVQVRAVALNYLDIFVRRGMPGKRIPLPHISGADVAGVVRAVGPDVDEHLLGTRVLVDPAVGHGAIGEDLPGGLAEYAVVPAANLIPLPEHIAFEEAACLPIAYGTAWRMLVTRAQVRPGETVFILGASGGVGTAALQIAQLAGARVIAGSGDPVKRERLRALGADETVDTGEGFDQEVWALTGKRGVDVLVNYTGGETLAPSARAMRKGGRMVICGATAGYQALLDLRYVWVRELSILGSDGWTGEELRTVCRLAWEGRIRPVIDRVLPLSQAVEAELALERREVFGKIILRP
jgi:alcohol dehydrogenase